MFFTENWIFPFLKHSRDVFLCDITHLVLQVHDNLCAECNTGGHLLLCDTCTHVYHLQCLSPPLDKPPEAQWICPKCQVSDLASLQTLKGPRQANLVLIAYASSEGSGEPAHPRSHARTSAAGSYKQWVKRSLQTESQILGPSEWLGMRS